MLPATLGKVPGVSYAVGGLTAGNHDFDAQLAKTVPWVFAFVLGLAFLLLLDHLPFCLYSGACRSA